MLHGEAIDDDLVIASLIQRHEHVVGVCRVGCGRWRDVRRLLTVREHEQLSRFAGVVRDCDDVGCVFSLDRRNRDSLIATVCYCPGVRDSSSDSKARNQIKRQVNAVTDSNELVDVSPRNRDGVGCGVLSRFGNRVNHIAVTCAHGRDGCGRTTHSPIGSERHDKPFARPRDADNVNVDWRV